MKRRKFVIVLLAISLFVTVGVVHLFQQLTNQRETIIIGAALNLTGAASEYGKCGLDAIRVIQTQLGELCDTNKVAVKFIIEDTGSTAKGTINAYNAIRLKAPNCKIVLSQGSTMGAAISEFTKRDGVLQFSAGAFSKPVSSNPYFYVNISDEMSVARMFLDHTVNVKSGVAFYIDDDFGNAVVSILSERAKGKFLNVPFTQDINARSLVSKVNLSNTDVVLLIGWGPNMLNVIKGLREIGYSRPIFSTTELQSEANKKALANMANNVYCMAYSQPPEDVMRRYWDVLQKKDLYVSDINIYNATCLSIAAMAKAIDKYQASITAEKIQEQFTNPDVIKCAPCLLGIEYQRMLYKMEFMPL